MLIIVVGAVPSPFDCYLVNRGLKTLHIRMREHEKNAMTVAKHLESSPHVVKVYYPGTYAPVHIVCDNIHMSTSSSCNMAVKDLPPKS